jgi:hypothetical protein
VSRKKGFAWGAGVVLTGVAILWVTHLIVRNPVFIRGAVLTSDRDPAKELPIAGAEVGLLGGEHAAWVRSDASGLFAIPIPLQQRMRPGLKVTIHFQHPDYQPLVLRDVAWDRLCIAHLTPVAPEARAQAAEPDVKIANVVANYSISTTAVVNVGSAVKTFQVVNAGNVPCKGHSPCSPDGKWKAAVGSVVIDAGPDNEFRNARASCVAGPCPFTKIDTKTSDLAPDSRTIRVAALDWSDTATFLLEAEVYKAVVNDVLRQSYPVIFDRALTFTLPPGAEGASIEAEVNGTAIVFPLGPALNLSWANCQLQVNKDRTRVYRCELKRGYRFS